MLAGWSIDESPSAGSFTHLMIDGRDTRTVPWPPKLLRRLLSNLAAAALWLVAATCASGLDQGKEYPLSPGDGIYITITGVPIADQQSMAKWQHFISNAGTIRLQHLKTEVRAAGLTPAALAREIESMYKASKIYSNPTVQVTRHIRKRVPLFITVSGKVRNPGSQIFWYGMLIADALAQSGGFDDSADPSKVRLFRAGKRQEIDLSVINGKGGMMELQPGDIIAVPETKAERRNP